MKIWELDEEGDKDPSRRRRLKIYPASENKSHWSITFLWVAGGILFLGGLGVLIRIDPSEVRLPMETTVPAQVTDMTARPLHKGNAPVPNRPPKVQSLTVEPRPLFAGARPKAEAVAMDPDGDPVQISYHWLINGEEVDVTSDGRFPSAILKKHDQVRVRAIPSDGTVVGPVRESPLLVVQNRPPRITSKPGMEFDDTGYNYLVKALDPDGDFLLFSLKNAPEGMAIHPETGELTWPIPDELHGRIKTVIVATDDDGAQAFQQFILTFD